MEPPGLLGTACLWASVYKKINHFLFESVISSLWDKQSNAPYSQCTWFLQSSSPLILLLPHRQLFLHPTPWWRFWSPAPSLFPPCVPKLYALSILSKPRFCKWAISSHSLYLTPIPPSTPSSTVTSSWKSSLIPQTSVRLCHKHLSLSNSRLSCRKPVNFLGFLFRYFHCV